jgi:hypothetical protein
MARLPVGVAAIVFAGVAALALRVVIEGRSALARGDEANAANRFPDAIAAWESAARWYFPLAPHVDAAYDRLREFAKARRSVAAWRAIRSAALATRGPWQPHAEDLADADRITASRPPIPNAPRPATPIRRSSPPGTPNSWRDPRPAVGRPPSPFWGSRCGSWGWRSSGARPDPSGDLRRWPRCLGARPFTA